MDAVSFACRMVFSFHASLGLACSSVGVSLLEVCAEIDFLWARLMPYVDKIRKLTNRLILVLIDKVAYYILSIIK